ncbi:MAG TPA: cobalamin biosynthesis protein [Candidatus Flavonifractor intestinipullorum]|uniref:Cobalamin biosynthesis protein n=1 Tax=Candidatus Flavonifractor intestinipullorum TaxID=2838587 RepID=A0A9D2MAY3_9FIRM|nr:cobalamin biosynthesis protein [Candidatus Flavonifractor intestinipullorum]
MRLALTAFTRRGYALARDLAAALEERGDRAALALPARLAGELGAEEYASLAAWTGERFQDCQGLIFVGACGIAVRAIAPHVRDKFTDPAVVSVDEAGRIAVPLLSGHVGGANELALWVAGRTGGEVAVSTATDVNGAFAVDRWAKRQGLFLDSREAAKRVSAAVLARVPVGVSSDFPIQGGLPSGLRFGPAEVGICLTLDPEKAPFPVTLRLVPPVLTLGIGCRRGTPAETLRRRVEDVLKEHRLTRRAVFQASTLDLKGDEPGLLELCRAWEIPLVTWTAEELARTEGEFTPSAFVSRVTGVDNVCERAAVRAGGALLVPKQAGEGVTVAVARRPWTISFDEGEK